MRRRGAAAALLLALGLEAMTAGAFETKQAASGRPVRWHQQRVSWNIDPSMHQLGEAPGIVEEVARALGTWSGREGAPTLSVVGTNMAREPGFDGVNGIYLAPGGHGGAPRHALAVTIVTFDDATGRILDADIVFNGAYRFTIGQAGDGDGYPLARVLAHEMGHALGLSDEPECREALMYPVIDRTERSWTAAVDDLAGVRALYGAEASATTPVPSASCHAASVSAVGAGHATTLALSLVTCAIVRRRRRYRAALGSSARSILRLAPGTFTIRSSSLMRRSDGRRTSAGASGRAGRGSLEGGGGRARVGRREPCSEGAVVASDDEESGAGPEWRQAVAMALG